MGSQFRIMDHNHSNELSKEEFSTALDVLLGCFNLHFSAAEKLNLFQQFDRDSSRFGRLRRVCSGHPWRHERVSARMGRQGRQHDYREML